MGWFAMMYRERRVADCPHGAEPADRLRSLWEMLEKHALLFMQATTAFVEAKYIIAVTAREQVDTGEARAQIRTIGQHAIHYLKRACILSEIDGIMPEIDRVSASFDHLVSLPGYNLETVAQTVKHLLSRIHDELTSQHYFHLDQRDVQFYVAEYPFGLHVAEKFVSATEDISEAGKCLALQRPTACVFHLMRVMERGVQALGKKLKVKIKVRDETWHQIMLHVNNAVVAMPSKSGPQKTKKSKYAGAASHLQTVRLAWRNEVMHPKQTYTRGEAFDIFSASKVFMTSLAEIV
jgi:hypothetical protein